MSNKVHSYEFGGEEPPYLTVEILEWIKGPPGAVLETDGLGPCTGLAIFDPESRTGHLGHTVMPHEDNLFDDMIQSALDLQEDPSKWKVWIRGSAINRIILEDDPEFDYEAYHQESRNYLLGQLSKAGVTEIDVEWSDPDDVVSMRLDCNKGICEILVLKDYSATSQYNPEEDM